MAFYQKIILAALAVTVVGAGAGLITAQEAATPVVADPGWWLALGEELIGTSENGWCRCL